MRFPVLLTLLVLPALAAPVVSAGEEHAPKLVVDSMEYDFGEADNTRTVEHTFLLRNEGDLTLEITQTRPACGCTVASLSSREIAPGEQAELTARLSLAGRRGPQHKAIAVHSNDPQQPQINLLLKGTAVEKPKPVMPSRTRVAFGRVRQDAPVATTVDIRVNQGGPTAITNVTLDTESFEVTHEVVTEGQAFRLVIHTRPPLPVGNLVDTVRVYTDNPQQPLLEIPVYASVVGPVTIGPEKVTLHAGNNLPVTRYILVRPGTAAAFKVTAVEAPDPDIKVNVYTVAPGGYRIQLSNLVARPELDGLPVTIRTDLTELPVIEVPIEVIQPQPAPGAPGS